MTAVALQQWHTWRACACASASAGGNTLSGTASDVGSLKAGIAALTLPVRDGVRLNDTIPYRHTKEQQQQTGGRPCNRKQSSSFRLIHLPVLSCTPKLGTPPVTQNNLRSTGTCSATSQQRDDTRRLQIHATIGALTSQRMCTQRAEQSWKALPCWPGTQLGS